MSVYLVTPWFGVDSGGAERAAMWFAAESRTAGFDLRVLATTLGNPFEDAEAEPFAPGEGSMEGIPVIRFRPYPRNPERFAELWQRIEAGGQLSDEEQREFFRENVSSPDMEDFIRGHPDDVYMFIPYCYGTTVLGAAQAKQFLLIPCLHDEALARLPILRPTFARNRGVVFLSEPEKELFQTLYGSESIPCSCVTGLGVPEKPECHPERFYSRRFANDRQVLLFIGRKHPDKGVGELICFFDRYIRENPDSRLVLALVGPGGIVEDLPPEGHIRDLGVLAEQEKWDALAGCFALVHPSIRESFSIVLMEAWACERPVIVHEDCAVTRGHAQSGNGGLWYTDYPTFAACLDYLVDHPETASAIGRQGREYVEREYNQEKVREVFVSFVKETA